MAEGTLRVAIVMTFVLDINQTCRIVPELIAINEMNVLVSKCSFMDNLEAAITSVNLELLVVAFDGDLTERLHASDALFQVPLQFLLFNETVPYFNDFENSLVIVDLDQPRKISEVFLGTSMHSLESNLWIVLEHKNQTNVEQVFSDNVTNRKPLSLQSQIYYLEDSGHVVEILGNANADPEFQVNLSCHCLKTIL